MLTAYAVTTRRAVARGWRFREQQQRYLKEASSQFQIMRGRHGWTRAIWLCAIGLGFPRAPWLRVGWLRY